jgi:hypothetical protein
MEQRSDYPGSTADGNGEASTSDIVRRVLNRDEIGR